jgi:hypothetical protein
MLVAGGYDAVDWGKEEEVMEKSMNPDKEDSENREDLICFPP